LRRAGGKKNKAARLLGITRQALWKKIRKSGNLLLKWQNPGELAIHRSAFLDMS